MFSISKKLFLQMQATLELGGIRWNGRHPSFLERMIQNLDQISLKWQEFNTNRRNIGFMFQIVVWKGEIDRPKRIHMTKK